jgi:hypothetical protein
MVILNRYVPGAWWIRESEAPDPYPPERFLTANDIESLPSTGNLWSLLNRTESSVVTDIYDISGLHSDSQLLLGVRGSSWTQNQGVANGQTVSHPAGDGMLIDPDLTAVDSIVYTIGDSGTRHSGPGAHVEWTQKAGLQESHGQAQLFFQGGALQNTNVTARDRSFGITQSDERWKHFINGGVQLGGPLVSRRWTYFSSVSVRDLRKWIRNQALPVSGTVGQENLTLSGELSSGSRLTLHGSAHQQSEPQAGASPQITRESSISQFRKYRLMQGSWIRTSSSQSVLDVRFGVALGSLNARFQNGASGQSSEDLFPGFLVVGKSPAVRPDQVFATLNNTRRGPAPLITSFDAGSAEGSGAFVTTRNGFRHSTHQISLEASFHRSSLTESNSSIDGVNPLFFQQKPNSVRILSTPARTRDGIRQLEFNASDKVSFSRFSFTAEVSVDSSQGASFLSSGESINKVHWTNGSGRLGVAYLLPKRRPLVLRAGMALIYDQPTTNVWTAANPEGLGVRLYSWNDANGDLRFQPGENTQLLKVYGGPYTRMDPSLRNPRTSESTVGLTQSGIGHFTFEISGFHRSVQRLMTLVNEGVSFSAYTPVQVMDPGPDAIPGTADDRMITVFNQKAETLGHDRYVLTNPNGFSSHSEGLEFKLHFGSTRVQAEASVSHYRAVAATGSGFTARENDTSAFLGVYDDPNKATFARGSTFFDRGTLGRFWATAELGWRLRATVIGSYQDGLPYSRVLPIQGLNQGVIGVLTTQRGPGEPGSRIGPMTSYYETIDLRLMRNFVRNKGTLAGTLDVFNLLNTSQSLVEANVTSLTQYWRVPLRFETPRSLQLGLRYSW